MTFKKSKILHIFIIHLNFVAVQSFSHVQLFVTLWARACQDSLFFTISWSLLKLMSIESVMPSNLILCHSLLLLPSIIPRIRVFFWVHVLQQVAKVLEFQLQHQEWFPLGLTALTSLCKGTWRIFSNMAVLKHQFFGAQFSLWSIFMVHVWMWQHPYMTTGKIIALTIQTFVGNVPAF